MALISYNIKTDFSATGNGQQFSEAITIAHNSTALHTTNSLFVSGDTGKTIAFTTPDTSAGVTVRFTAIITFVSGTQVTLASQYAGTAMTASTQTIEWGNDDAAAFESFNSTARADQASNPTNSYQLNIPAGRYEFIASASNSNQFIRGLKNVSIVGSGSNAILSDLIGTGAGFNLSADALKTGGVGVSSARIVSVNAGASSLTTVAAGDAALWAAGDIALISGIDLQGGGSAPPNWQLYEYITVQTVNAGTGVITFTPALRNSYLSTWPNYDTGGGGQYDQAGPATLNVFDQTWNGQALLQDFVIDQQYSQTKASYRDISLVRISNNGGPGYAYPSQCRTVSYDTCSMLGSTIEMDKLVDVFTITNSTMHRIDFQSPGANTWNVSNTTWNGINGTARNSNFTNVTTTANSLTLGCHSYGTSQSVVCTNCTFDDVSVGGFSNTQAGASLSNGIITVPVPGVGPVSWGVPGAVVFPNRNTTFNPPPYRITGLSRDGSGTVSGNTYLQTTLTNPATFAHTIHTHPCPSFQAINCTSGSVHGTDILSASAVAAPAWSHLKRTMGATPPAAVFNIFGQMVQMIVTVNTAGASGTFGLGGPNTVYMGPNWTSTTTFDISIDLTKTGTRIITPTTFIGGQGADSVTPPGIIWFEEDQMVPSYSSGTISGASVTLEIYTDQGLNTTTPPALAGPLWLLLHQ